MALIFAAFPFDLYKMKQKQKKNTQTRTKHKHLRRINP